jgi:hypothetical protein
MTSSEKTSIVLNFLESLSATENSSSEKNEVDQYISNPDAYINRLRENAKALFQSTKFKIGDVVSWKDGLKNKRYPAYKQPAIVLEMLEPFIKDNDPSYNEKLTIKLGFIISSLLNSP